MGICGAVAGGMLMRSAGFGWIRRNHHYDSRCHDCCSPSYAACGFDERQKDVRSAPLSVKQAWRIQMSSINRMRTVFIRVDTPLPTTISIESEAFLPGWRVVKNLDRQALTREVEGANWNSFYLAGEMRATVFGREGLGALRRVVKCVLAKKEGQKFNCLEITKVVSKRFLGIPFMSVVAHSPPYPTRCWPGPC
jgi:hypothetical protein